MVKNPIEQAGKWKDEECKTSKSYICQKNSGEFSFTVFYYSWFIVLCQTGVKSDLSIFNPILTKINLTVSRVLLAILMKWAHILFFGGNLQPFLFKWLDQ